MRRRWSGACCEAVAWLAGQAPSDGDKSKPKSSGSLTPEETRVGLLTFSLNVTLDGCIDHQEGIADDETHAFFSRLMDDSGAMLWGRTTYDMMEGYWPAVARGDVPAPPAVREWANKLETKPKYVLSSTRSDFPWRNSHHMAGDLRAGVQQLKDATPAGVLLGISPWLGLATLAEGVETPGEHAMLAQLGCGDVQGFGIARPMPFEDTIDWIARHRAAQSHQHPRPW